MNLYNTKHTKKRTFSYKFEKRNVYAMIGFVVLLERKKIDEKFLKAYIWSMNDFWSKEAWNISRWLISLEEQWEEKKKLFNA